MKRELVAALIIRNKRVLLVENVKHNEVRMEPPGGKVHAGETSEASVSREVYEETGLKVGAIKPFGAYETISPEGAFIVHMYLCAEAEGEPVVREPDKISSIGWYGVEELIALKREGTLVPNMCEALEELKGYMR